MRLQRLRVGQLTTHSLAEQVSHVNCGCASLGEVLDCGKRGEHGDFIGGFAGKATTITVAPSVDIGGTDDPA